LNFFERFDEQETIAQATRHVWHPDAQRGRGDIYSERVKPITELEIIHPAELNVYG